MRDVRVRAASTEVHIASFVVQHRVEAADAMAAHIEAMPGMELALRGEVRSVVLCEGADQYAIVDAVDALRAIPGVLNATLVYHHAEPPEALDDPMPTAAGVTP